VEWGEGKGDITGREKGTSLILSLETKEGKGDITDIARREKGTSLILSLETQQLVMSPFRLPPFRLPEVRQLSTLQRAHDSLNSFGIFLPQVIY
jgi:hypothetical protein